MDIFHEAGDHEFFEILLGTHDGCIYHAAFEYSSQRLREGKQPFEVVEEFTCVLEVPDSKAILDIKMANINFDSYVVLAVTESSLYQFSGENVFKNLLLEYKGNSTRISKHQLTLEASI